MDNGLGRDNVRIVGLIDWQLRVLLDRRRWYRSLFGAGYST